MAIQGSTSTTVDGERNFRNLLLSGLDQADRRALLEGGAEVSLLAGAEIFAVGDPVLSLYLADTAVLSAILITNDGQAVETATEGFEGAFGILPILTEQPSFQRVIVQIEGTALKVPAGLVRGLARENHRFLQHLFKFAMANIAQANLSVGCNAIHTLSQRLTRLLLLTHDRVGGGIIPLTQEALSLMLDVQRTTVTAAVAALKERKIIDYSRGRIIVADRLGLEALARECYALGCAINNGVQRRGAVA